MKRLWLVAAAGLVLVSLMPNEAFAQGPRMVGGGGGGGGFRGAAIGGGGFRGAAIGPRIGGGGIGGVRGAAVGPRFVGGGFRGAAIVRASAALGLPPAPAGDGGDGKALAGGASRSGWASAWERSATAIPTITATAIPMATATATPAWSTTATEG